MRRLLRSIAALIGFHSEMTVDEHVGRRLKELRLSLGVSHEEVADLLDVAKRKVALMEEGDIKITPKQLFALAKYFQVPAYFFFNRERGEA